VQQAGLEGLRIESEYSTAHNRPRGKSMTTLATRIKQIQEIEKFRIRVRNKRTNKIIPKDQHRFRPYPHVRKLGDTKTVSDYVLRFERAYPGYTCDVGERVHKKRIRYRKGHGNKHLDKIRATYL
jgi:hypothetical protein